MITRKYYRQFVIMFGKYLVSNMSVDQRRLLNTVISNISDIFAGDNRDFDRQIFREAIEREWKKYDQK